MQTGRASRTALGVAARRAAHQLLDHPPVLDDPIAVPLLGAHFQLDRDKQEHPVARAFRAFMAARSRYAEDNLALIVASSGVRQYVLLGAGLDTFAYRNPYTSLRVFEVDFPATQEWKRGLLREARIAEPSNLTFVPLDFEHHTLAEGLTEAGFNFTQPAFFCWLGVVPYLTLPAFRATVDLIAAMPAGSGVSFDYALSDEELSPRRRQARAALAARVAAAGEPFRLFFRSEQLENELKSAGFQRMEQLDSDDTNARYFTGRKDGLALPEEGLGKLATAWV
jgi:methyltransferase (TIGR00027 family)